MYDHWRNALQKSIRIRPHGGPGGVKRLILLQLHYMHNQQDTLYHCVTEWHSEIYHV